MSNYAYGRNAEARVGRELVNSIKGASFTRTRGSRTPADVHVTVNGVPLFAIQVKSSRANTKTTNKNSITDRSKLINYSYLIKQYPLTANLKGRKMEIRDAMSDKLLFLNY